MPIYTIGYEGSSIDSWLAHLTSLDITCLVDIREIPLSRKQGFSKNKLREAIEASGIKYVHIKSLGSPSEIRNRLRDSGDYISFFDEYEQYLDTCVDELAELCDLAMSETICLLCFEQNPHRCHRKSVATRLSALIPEGVEVVNVDCGKRVERDVHLHHRKDLSHAQ